MVFASHGSEDKQIEKKKRNVRAIVDSSAETRLSHLRRHARRQPIRVCLIAGKATNSRLLRSVADVGLWQSESLVLLANPCRTYMLTQGHQQFQTANVLRALNGVIFSLELTQLIVPDHLIFHQHTKP